VRSQFESPDEARFILKIYNYFQKTETGTRALLVRALKMGTLLGYFKAVLNTSTAD
jgi:hypothetical protein